MLLLMIMTHMNQQNAQRRRRAWVWPRPQNMAKEHFRVTRETFEYLCDLVRVKVKQKKSTRACLIDVGFRNVF